MNREELESMSRAYKKGYDLGFENGRMMEKNEQEKMCATCIHKVSADDIKAIEKKARECAIEEYRKEMQDMIEGNEEFTDWQKYEILECNNLVAEQLKEKKE